MSGKYIIGGGISGLVFQFYHPEYTIITPDIGGLFKSAYIAIIHDTAETRHFLKDLGYENVDRLAKKSYIGYYNKGWITDVLTPSLNLLVIQKKMTEWNKSVDLDFRPETFDMSTSKTVNYFKTMNIEPAQVIEKLKERAGNIIEGKVIRLNDKVLEYDEIGGGSHEVEYDSIVSTVAAPIFWKMYGQERVFPFTPITNVITDHRPKLYNDRYGSVYYDDSVPYSRITHLIDKYAYEFTGVLTNDDFNRLVGSVGDEKLFTVQFGRISSVPENEPPNSRITFLGRFAQWKYGIVLEHVVKRTLEFKPNQV